MTGDLGETGELRATTPLSVVKWASSSQEALLLYGGGACSEREMSAGKSTV